MLRQHLATCKFTPVPCPNKCKDRNNKVRAITRKDLDDHVKNHCYNGAHRCRDCGQRGTFAYVTRVHIDLCPRKIVACPTDGCTEELERRDVSKHIDTRCEWTTVSCKYENLGCSATLTRRDMVTHEQNDSLHLHMAIDTINSLTDTLKSGEPVKLELNDYQRKKAEEVTAHSAPFYIYPRGYRMALQVYPNGSHDGQGTHVSVFGHTVGGRYDTELKWPLVGRIKFTLLNQLEDGGHYSKTMELTLAGNVGAGNSWGFLTFIPHSALGYNPAKRTEFLKHDTLHFRMLVKVANHKPWLD